MAGATAHEIEAVRPENDVSGDCTAAGADGGFVAEARTLKPDPTGRRRDVAVDRDGSVCDEIVSVTASHGTVRNRIDRIQGDAARLGHEYATASARARRQRVSGSNHACSRTAHTGA